MILFIALSVALWVLGWRMKVPRKARWSTIGLLYLLILALVVILPKGNPIGAALGPARDWQILGMLILLVLAYTQFLRFVRTRLRPENREAPQAAAPVVPDPDQLGDTELERYSRQLLLREVGGPGQMRLRRARVLVVGAGGLGSPVLQYLAGAGVGTLGVIDDDSVSLSNLHRQILHDTEAVGTPKVASAQQALARINPHVTLRPYERRLTDEIAVALMADYDLVIDGTDNFETRYLVNRACVATGTPLIAGAITQWEGQLSLYDPARGGPCYQCVFPEAPAPGLVPSCAEAGVIGPLPGVIGTMMALEAVKHLTGAGATLRGSLRLFDGLFGENRQIRVEKRGDCPVCGGQ